MAVKTKDVSTVTSHFQFIWMKGSIADMAFCSVHFQINHQLSVNIRYLNIRVHKNFKFNYMHLYFWAHNLFVLLAREWRFRKYHKIYLPKPILLHLYMRRLAHIK